MSEKSSPSTNSTPPSSVEISQDSATSTDSVSVSVASSEELPKANLPENATVYDIEKYLRDERLRIIHQVRREFQTQFEIDKRKALDVLQEENKKAMEHAIAEFKKEQTPLTQIDIQQMLDAEYIRFPIKVVWKTKPESKPEEIVIGELSAFTERKLIRLLKEKLTPTLNQFAPALISIIQGENTDKIAAVMELVDPAADILQELVAIILTAHSGHEISKDLVENSMGFNRQLGILTAQLEANKMRDFFSRVARMSGR